MIDGILAGIMAVMFTAPVTWLLTCVTIPEVYTWIRSNRRGK